MTGVDEDRVYDLSGGFRRDPAPRRDPLGDVGEALDAFVGRCGDRLRFALAYARRRPGMAFLRVAKAVSGTLLIGWVLAIVVLAYLGWPR